MKQSCREKRGLELRRTHFDLGKDQWGYQSQYIHDYPPWPFGANGPNMDSVTLRNSHFKLGDDELNYKTTSMIQSSKILDGAEKAGLDPKAKMELQKSHFIMGNFDPNYVTSNAREYYDKSALNNRDNPDFKKIESSLRQHNYVLGDDKPDYTSEAAAKYTAPKIDPRDRANQKRISTAELQKSHYVFGTFEPQMITTQRRDYQPKKVDQKLVTKNLTQTNFILGDEEPELKTVHETTYVKHPIAYNPINKELANDLRRNHFDFGNEDYTTQLVTKNNIDYQTPKFNPDDMAKQKISNQMLRASHWSLGNPEESKNNYNTTYTLDMTPKRLEKGQKASPPMYNSSFSVNGNGPVSYATEFRSNYIPMKNDLNPNEIKAMKDMVNGIKKSNFELGDMKNDYGTTFSNAYKYDPETAKNAKGSLDKQLINDLRSTHYKLGYQPLVGQTTYRRNYIPYSQSKIVGKDPNLQADHFSFGSNFGTNVFEGVTTYMTDFTEKPLPADDEC